MLNIATGRKLCIADSSITTIIPGDAVVGQTYITKQLYNHPLSCNFKALLWSAFSPFSDSIVGKFSPLLILTVFFRSVVTFSTGLAV